MTMPPQLHVDAGLHDLFCFDVEIETMNGAKRRLSVTARDAQEALEIVKDALAPKLAPIPDRLTYEARRAIGIIEATTWAG